MSIWNAANSSVLPDAGRHPPHALHELGDRLASRPLAAWDWIERLQETRLAAAATSRRSRGVVATPVPLAQRMARALLRRTPRGNTLRVLDAGCGSGRLLVAVAREAAARGVRVACEGVEVDAAAARWAAALEPLVRAGAGPALCGWSVRRADFLLAPAGRGSFDAAIANPPYVPWRDLEPAYRDRLRARSAAASADLAALFVAGVLDRLRPGGRLCVIVPNKLLGAGYAAALRARLVAETCLEEIWDLSGERVFHGHASYPVVLVARRTPPGRDHCFVVRDAAGKVRARWQQRVLAALPGQVLPIGMAPALLPIVGRLLAGKRFDDAVSVHCGIAVSGFGRAVGRGPDRIIRSGDVRAFHLRGSTPFAAAEVGLSRAALARQRQPKVLVPGMFRRLCAAYDGDGRLVGRVYFVLLSGSTTAERQRQRALLLALLNSRLYALVYAGLFGAVAQSGGYTRLNGPYLGCLPWPSADPGLELERLVDALESPGAGIAAHTARESLDRLVESLFGLGPEESRVLADLARALPATDKPPDARRPAG